jgi:hypothetical protein
MTSRTENSNGSSRHLIGRHFTGIAPDYSGERPSAADVRARGAADSMWQKVEDDLEKLDRVEIKEIEEFVNE